MSRRTPESYPRTRRSTWLLRTLVFLLVAAACLVALSMLYVRWQSTKLEDLELPGRPSFALNPIEELYLQGYLAANAERLSRPIDFGDEPATFIIIPGQNAEQIAESLADQGFIEDESLFRAYLRYNGLDSRLEAGNFQIDPSLTIPELARTLTRALAQDFEVRFLEGWRLEEMADYLDQLQLRGIDSGEFLSIARRRRLLDLSDYDFLNSLPTSATLEGFLFPDTYRVAEDTDAESLVRLMLDNMGNQLTPALRQQFGVQGLTIYEAVTLASIVEREGVLDDERQFISSVFLNRLNQGMRLEADPTVQYALGSKGDDGRWWKSPLSQDDLRIDSPYNTYQMTGLPPGPIASPGLASLRAVAEPADTDYFYFVVDCITETSGDHAFSFTYDEHLSKVQQCR